MAIIASVPVKKMEKGDVIYFGDDLVVVVGVDNVTNGVSILVTEGSGGMQYIDYVDPNRTFTVGRR